jgi:vacuolar-type H+-ATPase subunit E/Vma4
MAQNQSDRQIKQMVNFIMQEAHEKVNEIKIKVRKFPNKNRAEAILIQ